MKKIWKKIWIISDTHFNHQFMIDKKIRPKSYQKKIIDNWKKYISSNDIVIHLWDVIFSRPSELTEILNNLPWYKILVKWNHDKNSDNWYFKKGFNEVHEEYFLYIPIKNIIKKVHCTHSPIRTKAHYNLSWHLHNFKWNNTFRHKECLYLNNKSRIYSCELENYKPRLISYMISIYHDSHIYIMEKWCWNIKFSYILFLIKKHMNKILKYFIDLIKSIKKKKEFKDLVINEWKDWVEQNKKLNVLLENNDEENKF